MTEASHQPERVWRPFPAQVPFLATAAREALYGGAAGGGKTDALVVGPLRYVAHAKFTGIIFRRTFPELEGKVVPVSKEWYPALGGVYNGAKHIWEFPSGARIMLAHLQHEDDVLQYQGHEFQYIGWDELTHFTERQYVYLLSRLRTTVDLPLEVRAGTNPGGPGHEWVFKRWGPWLDPNCAVRARPGEVLRFDNTDHGEEWRPEGRFSRVFFPARAADNPYLNDDYIDNLRGQDAVTRAQLIDGNWLIKPAAGAYFKRAWFAMLDARPANVLGRVRRWDLASTEDGGDWTRGVLMSRTQDGRTVIEDVVSVRMRPGGVEATVLATARLDGQGVRIVLPQDPGQAGVAQAAAFAQKLPEYDVRFERETGDKITRAQPLSAQAEASNVALVRGAWNEPFVQELESFPEGAHDDQVDAAAGAYNALLEYVVPFIESDAPRRWTREESFIP